MAEQNSGVINGIDTNGVRELTGSVASEHPDKALVTFDVSTEWKGQTLMASRVRTLNFRGEMVERTHTMMIDEPLQLGGSDNYLNPQEALFAAFNSCIGVAFAVGAAMNGITLEKLELRSRGTLDLRGVFGIDTSVAPGYKSVELEIRIKGNGTPEQYQALLEGARAVSPNFYNLSQPIKIDTKLVTD
jgi:uncharacterized OsmC-like protein